MRIAFFTTRMMLGYGVDLTVHEIARRLAEDHGHSVDVWTPTSDGTYAGQNYNLREIIVYGARVNRVLPLLELNAWTALRKLKKKLAGDHTQYDVVVPCTHPYYGAGKALGVPSVFLNFGNIPTTGFSWKGKLNWAWLNFSEQVLHKPSAACVVSISRFLHQQQPVRIRNRGKVIHLGGDHCFPAPEGARSSFRAKHGISDDTVLIGYCGRLHREHPPHKGTKVVLELGRRIREQESDARLLMCGIGSASDREWIAGEQAIPLTNLPPAEMPAFYSALDLYLCASRWEGFNLPILEAAWHGVPSVAYDAGAHGEHVTAVLVSDGDVEGLFENALNLVRERDTRERLGAEASRRARRFSWDDTAGKLNEVLLGVLS